MKNATPYQRAVLSTSRYLSGFLTMEIKPAHIRKRHVATVWVPEFRVDDGEWLTFTVPAKSPSGKGTRSATRFYARRENADAYLATLAARFPCVQEPDA